MRQLSELLQGIEPVRKSISKLSCSLSPQSISKLASSTEIMDDLVALVLSHNFISHNCVLYASALGAGRVDLLLRARRVVRREVFNESAL